MISKTVIVQLPQLPQTALKKIQYLSRDQVKVFEKADAEFEASARDSEVILTNFSVPFTSEFLKTCSNLRYIGVYGTAVHNIDLVTATALGISVSRVTHYCDDETAELMFTELLLMARGIGKLAWKDEPRTLRKKSIGIIGMGGVGRAFAQLADAHGMNVMYYSPKPIFDPNFSKFHYVSKSDLLEKAEVIALHVSPNALALARTDFDKVRDGTILMNSCQGRMWNHGDLVDWLQCSENRLILDGFAFSQQTECEQKHLQSFSNVRVSPVWAYLTKESLQKISDIFIEQLQDFVKNKLS